MYDAAIAEGLENQGWEADDENHISFIREAIAANPFVHDADDAQQIAETLITYGTKEHCIDSLDDHMESHVTEITGLADAREVFEHYANKNDVLTSDFYEIYKGDQSDSGQDIWFVLDVA